MKRRRHDDDDDGEFEVQLEVPFSEVSSRLHEVMHRYGVAIVTGVVGHAELKELEQLFMQDLTELVDVEQARSCDDVRVHHALDHFLTTGPRAFPFQTARTLAPGDAGFLLHRCVSHGRFAWAVRKHPNVHASFEALHAGTGPLVTSLDATFFTPEGMPPHLCGSPTANPSTAHCDQNRHDQRPGALGECDVWQGVLYVWPAEDGCTTTVVWPGSHLTAWARMMECAVFREEGAYGNHYSEVCRVGGALEAELMGGWQQHGRRLRIPAGALLLWNSRTVHAGWRGAGPRLAQAVCLERATARAQPQRVAKLRLAALGVSSTPWARVGHQHDMILDERGYLADDAHSTRAIGADSTSKVTLPLRPAIRPAPLSQGADLRLLRDLVRVEWMRSRTGAVFGGMWEPPEGLDVASLETCIRREYLPLL